MIKSISIRIRTGQPIRNRVRKVAMLLAAAFLLISVASWAHEGDKKKPPTKAKGDLMMARKQMDAAKMKIMEAGRYSCCVKPPPGSKVGGCDMCAKMNGSCSCGVNLGQGKVVC